MLAERIEAHPAPCGARFYSDEIVPPTDGFDFSASLSAMPRQIQPPLCARPSRVLDSILARGEGQRARG